MDEVEQDTSGFLPILGVAQVAGFMAVVLMGIWTGHFLGGFAFQDDSQHQFNWHPLLMTLGMIYLYGNGILMYRMFRSERKKTLKLVHAAVMMTVFVLTVCALKAAFDSHNLHKDDQGNPAPIANLYTLHSWVGLVTVILFAFQWLAGLITFLFPGLASHLRAAYMPIHIFFGVTIFCLACVTALLGITEKTIWVYKDYADRVTGGVLANWIGILITIFGIMVIYLGMNPRFKRLARPEDGMLLTETNRE